MALVAIYCILKLHPEVAYDLYIHGWNLMATTFGLLLCDFEHSSELQKEEGEAWVPSPYSRSAIVRSFPLLYGL